MSVTMFHMHFPRPGSRLQVKEIFQEACRCGSHRLTYVRWDTGKTVTRSEWRPTYERAHRELMECPDVRQAQRDHQDQLAVWRLTEALLRERLAE